jgi:anti-anti-sigma factor
MGTATGLFGIECQGDTVIVTPAHDLREVDYADIEAAAKEVLDLLSSSPATNLIMDFHRTDYYGSTALAFFVKLWKRVCGRNGKMAFCNLSDHEKEILRTTRLDSLWSICPTRQEALAAVRADGERRG